MSKENNNITKVGKKTKMPPNRNITWKEYIEMLEYLTDHTAKQTALQFKISESAVNSRLNTLRKRLQETHSALKRIEELQKASDRIQKLTSRATPQTNEEEEEY